MMGVVMLSPLSVIFIELVVFPSMSPLPVILIELVVFPSMSPLPVIFIELVVLPSMSPLPVIFIELVVFPSLSPLPVTLLSLLSSTLPVIFMELVVFPASVMFIADTSICTVTILSYNVVLFSMFMLDTVNVRLKEPSVPIILLVGLRRTAMVSCEGRDVQIEKEMECRIFNC